MPGSSASRAFAGQQQQLISGDRGELALRLGRTADQPVPGQNGFQTPVEGHFGAAGRPRRT